MIIIHVCSMYEFEISISHKTYSKIPYEVEWLNNPQRGGSGAIGISIFPCTSPFRRSVSSERVQSSLRIAESLPSP